jgi:hypothetical protein
MTAVRETSGHKQLGQAVHRLPLQRGLETGSDFVPICYAAPYFIFLGSPRLVYRPPTWRRVCHLGGGGESEISTMMFW